jgi:hypothetical protein
MNIIVLIANVILYVALVIVSVEVYNGVGALIIVYFSIIELITSLGLLGEVIHNIQQTNSNRAYVINALYFVAVVEKRASRRKTRQTHRSSIRAIRAHRRNVKKARRLNRR